MMPFVKLSYNDAMKILENDELLKEFLRAKKINPYEYELLEEIKKIFGDKTRDNTKLRNLCKKFFSEDASKAFELLKRFTISTQKRVPWVLFSRTFQLIPYQEEDPLEGYQPTNDVIVFVAIKEDLVKK